MVTDPGQVQESEDFVAEWYGVAPNWNVGRANHIVVAQYDTLGPAGRPRCVTDQRNVAAFALGDFRIEKARMGRIMGPPLLHYGRQRPQVGLRVIAHAALLAGEDGQNGRESGRGRVSS